MLFGRNKNTTTSIEEYEASYDRIFGKKKPEKSAKTPLKVKKISDTSKGMLALRKLLRSMHKDD